MNRLDPAQLLALARKREKVEIDGLPHPLWVQELTAEQYSAYRSIAFVPSNSRRRMLKLDMQKFRHATAQLLTWAVCHEDGTPFFDEATGPGLVLQLPAGIVAKLADVASRLSGMQDDDEDDEDDEQERESVEVGNSAPTPSTSGSGTSPSLSTAPDTSSSPA